MAGAKQGNTVKVHYVGKLSNGKIFDTSKERGPLQFTIGNGQIIAGFEEGVIGMSPGETKTVTVEPDKGYGQKKPELIADIPKDQLPKEIQPRIGLQLKVSQPNGQVIPVVITSMTDSGITVDANHPLAGQDLTFEIELLEIA